MCVRVMLEKDVGVLTVRLIPTGAICKNSS